MRKGHKANQMTFSSEHRAGLMPIWVCPIMSKEMWKCPKMSN